MEQPTHKQSATDLQSLAPKAFRQWLDSFDYILFDCDGVLWWQLDAVAGAVKTHNALRKLGKRTFLVTNNSGRTRQYLLEKAIGLGFDVQLSDIITAASAAAAYLKHRNFTGKAYVIGMPSIGAELDAVGIRHCGIGPDNLGPDMSLGQLVDEQFQPDAEVGAVVVGFDEHFSFPKIFKAASYLDRDAECLFVGTNRDERVRRRNGHCMPETGPMLRSVEITAGRKCVLAGKPSPFVCDALLAENGGSVVAGRTLMVGDRCDTDVRLGWNCGFQTLLVGTGVHSLADVQRCAASEVPEERTGVPDWYAAGLEVVGKLMGLDDD